MTTFPKVYTVNGPSSTSSASLPSWITTKTRPTKPAGSTHRKRVKTQRQVGQLELVQDFAFPESAIKIKTTEDGHFAIGTGTYKPMMKVWDLDQLTVKFERVTDAENVDFVILSSDWTKTLHLQRDRSLSLHTQMGLHHTLRLPTYGRALAYHPPSAEALVACTGREVFRFNLEEGRHMTPLVVGRGSTAEGVEGVNVVDVNSRHGLWSFGLDGGGGVVEFWDPRSKSALTKLLLPATTLLPAQSFDQNSSLATPEEYLSVTALSSHPTDGLSLAVGTSTGHTLLYDLRSPTPFAIKDQGYGEPIKTVDWLRGGGGQDDVGRVITADSKVIKVWSKDEPTSNVVSLQPPSSLNDLHAIPQSGLLLVAADAPQLNTYYIPDLGPAPKWAGFLDNVTEELAEDAVGGVGKGAYVDMKFVDRQELETLGLTHLIGTQNLKPYMHGYFLSLKLYTAARLIANPTSYADQRDRLIAQKLAAKAESRIRARKDQPKVNKVLAERLRKAEEREEALQRRKKEKRGELDEAEDGKTSGKQSQTLLNDPRFKEIFENPEYEVDQESREFALLNPATANNNAARKTAVEDEEDVSDRSSSDLQEESDSANEGSDQDQDQQMGGSDEESDEESDDGDLLQYDPRTVSRTASSSQTHRQQQPRMVIGDAGDQRGAAGSTNTTFGQRSWSTRKPGKGKASAKEDGMDDVLAMRRGVDGGMEMSFVPKGRQSRNGNGYDGSDDENGEGHDGGKNGRRQGGSRGRGRGRGRGERFGAGMERGRPEEEGRTEMRGGRKERRHVGRSASKNTFRRR